jgi:ribosome biogenesis GTPase / thiamine phosphate phosphatase
VAESYHGIVTKITGLASTVDCGEAGVLLCDFRARLFRKDNLRLAVGDRVTVKYPSEEGQDEAGVELRGVIEGVDPRRSSLRRPRESKRDQVLCANIDQVFVVTSLANPPYKKGFIDRVLVAIEREGLKATLIFNKMDLVTEEDHLELIAEDLSVYGVLDYDVIFASAGSGFGLEEIRERLQNSVSVFTGPSGVGKSTLLNALSPGLSLKTGNIGKRGKGRHVTTSAVLLKFDGGGFVVDTPGVRAFGIAGVKPEELAEYFRDIGSIQGDCRFGDCRHRQEPGCAVLSAIEDGALTSERYESYLRIYDDLVEEASRNPRKPKTLGRS